jgi:ATP-binding cassette subfamily B protein RaxB
MIGLVLGFARHRSLKLVRQSEVTDCGLACIAMVADHHGLAIDLGTLRRRFGVSSRGAALKTLMSVADRLGLMTRAVRLPLEAIGELQLPAILHWDMNHFVVVERTAGSRALIHNPATRSAWMNMSEISRHFTGIAVEVSPADDFTPADIRQKLRLRDLWSRMRGVKRAVIQTVVLTLVMQAFVVASPYYMQLAIDQALPAMDANLMTVLAFGFALFTLINVAASVLRSFVLLSAGMSLSYGVGANLARRLFRLPIAWFERRHVGDILLRFQSIHPIQRTLTQGTIAALLDGFLAIFTLGMMFLYSPLLAIIGLTAFGGYAAVRAITFPLQRSAEEETIVANGREQSVMIESVRGMTTLRLFNRESSRHARWLTTLADATNATANLARIGIWQQALHTLIFGLEVVISAWIAVTLVMAGGFTVGMVFAYLAYKTLFLTRSASLIDELVSYRMLALHLERLSDIALSQEDRSFIAPAVPRRELQGRLELSGVCFRYGPADPFVLDGVNLIVEPGEHVAITGKSGRGKTTLVKVILGILEPNAGDILIDGVSLAQFGIRNFQDQVAAVLQDDNLFAGSLSDNIALFDDSPDQDQVVEAAKLAAIHDDICNMPMGYNSRVGDMGSALSGGQKQRVLLARALYRRPKLLVMDEGTAHLDAATERRVNSAIANLGITRIVIAHREETISAADTVYSASEGKIIKVRIGNGPETSLSSA